MIEMQEKGEKFINGLPILKYNEQGSRYVGRRGSGKPTVASCRPTGGLTRPTLRRIKLNKSLLVVKVVVLSFCLTSRSVNVAAFAVSGYRCFPDCN